MHAMRLSISARLNHYKIIIYGRCRL